MQCSEHGGEQGYRMTDTFVQISWEPEVGQKPLIILPQFRGDQYLNPYKTNVES
jgi:hypothetical protein